jgi:hydrogenase expression/formation protein HypC
MNKISKEHAEDSIAAYQEIAEAMQNGEISDEEGNSNYV